MNYCQKGKELLLGLKRSDWLPPYDEEGVRMIVGEMEDLYNRLTELFPDKESDTVKVTIAYYHQCLARNRRYLHSYFNYRMTKIRELRWQSGPVIPEGIRHDTLSPREREYFAGYSRLLGAYCQDIDVELTSDLEPPKNLLIEVRVLEKCGIIQTENGPISLDFGSVHFLRRSEVEHLIRDGKVEHVVNDDRC